MVREERLELSHLTILEPKSSASTNSATLALNLHCCKSYQKSLSGAVFLTSTTELQLFISGGSSGIRTLDQEIKSLLLYQLS